MSATTMRARNILVTSFAERVAKVGALLVTVTLVKVEVLSSVVTRLAEARPM